MNNYVIHYLLLNAPPTNSHLYPSPLQNEQLMAMHVHFIVNNMFYYNRLIFETSKINYYEDCDFEYSRKK